MSDAAVLVVGGGPAGVAAAIELRRRGVGEVILLDREPRLGGATRHCTHSPFGMREFGRVYVGAAYGCKLELEAERAGVDVRTGHAVIALEDDGTVVVASSRGVETLSASRILVATGVRERTRAARLAPGDRPIGILTTGSLQAYVAFHGLMPFRRPLIVGSELVSLSAALTCLTHGARPVAMIEPGAVALAPAPWTWFPALAGVPFHRNADLVDILGRERVEAATIRRPGGIETLACDGVLFTGQFTPEASLFLQGSMGVAPGSGGPSVDQDGRSRHPLYFAGGNLLRAVETGGWAYREGRAIGSALAADLHQGPTPAARAGRLRGSLEAGRAEPAAARSWSPARLHSLSTALPASSARTPFTRARRPGSLAPPRRLDARAPGPGPDSGLGRGSPAHEFHFKEEA